jgi:hypothetical protein
MIAVLPEGDRRAAISNDRWPRLDLAGAWMDRFGILDLNADVWAGGAYYHEDLRKAGEVGVKAAVEEILETRGEGLGKQRGRHRQYWLSE